MNIGITLTLLAYASYGITAIGKKLLLLIPCTIFENLFQRFL